MTTTAPPPMPVPSPGELPGEFVYDAALPNCPARQLLDQIGTRWSNLMLIAMTDGPRRYTELLRFVPGASRKMVTQTLRMLERNGMVERTITPTVPVRVDYALTGLGRSLLPLVWAVKVWAESHMDTVASAREDYDARETPPVSELNRRG
ncbi:DNA-binding HxlR family transcriptional regulator [Phytomonospora endophytica]|uniref:DNA-binding HxlR family transcriptional regulator n=2 Tax=Phytomonospora endophytica TaxID=714109 RepID=A0A841FV57_9ACTN|nr:DNA-binding HxlR family transcriptional regulator [Phytomonospora endophytica]